jgi:acetyltransferase-like isoleucine patch superfamily enzyme
MLLVGILPSPVKQLIYRLKGYRIGAGVRLGFGSVVIGQNVELGDAVSLGLFTVIRGKTLKLGPRVQIGAITMIDIPHVELGADTKINEHVFIGGLQFPDSRFVVGRNCLIMQSSYINPCRSIIIGDDSAVGVNCLLIGHASWCSQFDGYPVHFEPITIGKGVALAWRVTVLPGARISDGAVIGANSLVKGLIPSRCLATGSPARVVARAPYYPRALTGEDRARLLGDLMTNLVAYLNGSGLVCVLQAGRIHVGWQERGWLFARQQEGVICFSTHPLGEPADAVPPPAGSVFVSLAHLPPARRRALSDRRVLWLDLEQKQRSPLSHALGEEVVQFLRRYGVRFDRDDEAV